MNPLSAKTLFSVLTALAVTGVSLTAAACPRGFDPCRDMLEIEWGDGTYFVVHDDVQPTSENGVDFKIYHETNGEPGLQRGGVALNGNVDSCQEAGANADLAVVVMNHEDYEIPSVK